MCRIHHSIVEKSIKIIVQVQVEPILETTHHMAIYIWDKIALNK